VFRFSELFDDLAGDGMYWREQENLGYSKPKWSQAAPLKLVVRARSASTIPSQADDGVRSGLCSRILLFLLCAPTVVH